MTHRLLHVPLAALLVAGCGLDEVDVDVTAEETIPGVPVPGGLPLTLSWSLAASPHGPVRPVEVAFIDRNSRCVGDDQLARTA